MTVNVDRFMSGRKRFLSIVRSPNIYADGPRKTTRNLRHDTRSLGRDSNSELPEYEAELLTTNSRHSVIVLILVGATIFVRLRTTCLFSRIFALFSELGRF
jgi:hypothetical protein